MPDQKAQKITIRNRKGTEGKLSHGAITEVLINGKPVNGITFLKVEIKAKNMTKITMELLGDVEFEGLGYVVGKPAPAIYNPPKKLQTVFEIKNQNRFVLPRSSKYKNKRITVSNKNNGMKDESLTIIPCSEDYIEDSRVKIISLCLDSSQEFYSNGTEWILV